MVHLPLGKGCQTTGKQGKPIEEKARQEDNLTQNRELLNVSDEAMVCVSDDNPGLLCLDVYFGKSCRLTLSSFKCGQIVDWDQLACTMLLKK